MSRNFGHRPPPPEPSKPFATGGISDDAFAAWASMGAVFLIIAVAVAF